MAEESPQNINPATDPQVEDPPSTAVPLSAVDRAPGEVSPGADPQVPEPQTVTVPANSIEAAPGAVGPGLNPQVPTPIAEPSQAFVIPEAQPPAFEPFQVAQLQGGIIPGDTQGLDLPRVGTVAPVVTENPGQGSVPALDTVTVTAPREVTDPSTVGIPVRDETGALSNIRINPETGQPYNAQGLPAAQFPETSTAPPAAQVQTSPAPTPDATPQTPAPAAPPPPVSQTETAPAPAPAEDYGSSGDAAALEQAQRAEAEAFRQGRIPQPVTDPPNPQIPAADGTTAGPGITGQVPGVSPYGEANDLPAFGDGTTAGPGITGQVPGVSPYGEADDPPIVDVNRDPEVPDPGPYDYIDNDPVPDPQPDPRAEGENVGSVRDQALASNLRTQQAIAEQRRNNVGDWRVRLRLAPGAKYLYNAPDPGILQPLAVSDGVIFPYTPTINTVYKANYNPYDLTHSNYRGYFYQSSVVDDIQITGTFTAQDTVEAEYLLAVIHFFRSVTKMFYGGDVQRGAPPPLVYLSAFGQFQYVDAPCVVSQFNYNLPADVDYVRARSPNQNATNLLKRRDRQTLPSFLSFSPPLQRLFASRLSPGDPRALGENVGSVLAPPTLGLNSPTYVPTKIDITVVLHPMQSRKQVSQQFSLKDYASGRLQQKGYW
jgi:hypothetical protein